MICDCQGHGECPSSPLARPETHTPPPIQPHHVDHGINGASFSEQHQRNMQELMILNNAETYNESRPTQNGFIQRNETSRATTLSSASPSELTPSSSVEAPEPLQNGWPSSTSSTSTLPLHLRNSDLTVEIPELHLSSPRSFYEPFDPPYPQKSEPCALEHFRPSLEHIRATSPQSAHYFELQLDDFAIYLDKERYPCHMRCLHQLNTKQGCSTFFFDGVLSNNGEGKTFVKRIEIVAVPIGQYGLDHHGVGDQIFLKSKHCNDGDLCYKLGTPAKEYRRFHKSFLWVANLAKHFVDFLVYMEQKQTKVSIQHFQSTFKDWLVIMHEDAPELIHWLAQHPSTDFRTSIVANIAFLHKEYNGLLFGQKQSFHHVWAEIWDFTMYTNVSDMTKSQPTIVTEYVHQLFSHLPFGDRLQGVPTSPDILAIRKRVTLNNGLDLPSAIDALHSTGPIEKCHARPIRDIQPGDTISTKRDDKTSGSIWEREVSNGFADVDRWFALVQKVCETDGTREFEVLWYYRPVDTLCGLMKYPWDNELFLSDHCSCSEKHKIQGHEVLGIHDVEFEGDCSTKAEFFCRQIYLSDERKSLQGCHLRCSHISSIPSIMTNFQPGYTLLVHINVNSLISEPCELISVHITGNNSYLRFRRLLRRRDIDTTALAARCNELVYTNQFAECATSRVMGQCHVRFFTHNSKILTPYDRDGVGGFFYITHQISSARVCTPLNAFPTSLRQGFDPSIVVPKLRGLDLFCGGGNFGRGLEEGGAISMSWANDCDERAVHTYMANYNHPNLMSPFLGSIDDFQRQALSGIFSKSVPPVGDVDFVSGGSPCPGFSRLTNDKTTPQQRKNQSLVAAFASCIDLYRPKYGLLENVPGIIQRKSNRDQDVFSQLMCAIVGIGYQAQFFFVDSSSCGSAQRRSRVFLSFSAPNYKLPDTPQQTHSHPPDTRSMGLGRLPTGDPLVVREILEATPFTYITAKQATSDLPNIYDSQTDTCISFPDHRLPRGLTKELRARISLIPNRPWGMNFREASAATLTPVEKSVFLGRRRDPSLPAQANIMDKNSMAFGRLLPNSLMTTITTRQTPTDRKQGRQLHWEENRTLSVMEARRAQGFLDDEVILGTPAAQYRIVGNSVAREVALALGLSIRAAWMESFASIQDIEANAQSNRFKRNAGYDGESNDASIHNENDMLTSSMTDMPSRMTTIPRKRRRLTNSRLLVEIPSKNTGSKT